MKTRLVTLTYRGSASVDPRYSAAMLPWTINDIRSTENYSRLSIGIENGSLEAYNSDFELQFSHPLQHIVGMCRIIHKQNGKMLGHGFMQLKAGLGIGTGSGSGSGNANGNGTYAPAAGNSSANSQSNYHNNGFASASRTTLTTSTSYGSLSASTAAAYHHQMNAANATNSSAQQTDGSNDSAAGNNFMEFTGPMTGLVYLMKDPRDPLLHIYLFECETLEDMAELMHQMRDPAHTLGGSVGSIPQSLISTTGSGEFQKTITGNGFHATPASNIKLTEALRNAQQEPSPTIALTKMKSSKSYTHGLSNSAGTVNIPTSTSAQSNLSLLADISPNHTHFFEVLYIGKIRVPNKRVPYSFIDDTLPKFKAYDAQRARYLQMTGNRKMSLNSEGGINIEVKGNSMKDSDVREEDETEQEDTEEQQPTLAKEIIITDTASSSTDESKDNDKENVKVDEEEEVVKKRSPVRTLLRGQSQVEISTKKDSAGTTMDSNDFSENDENNCNLSSNKRPGGTVIINKNPSPPRTTDPTKSNQQLHPTYGVDNIPKQRDRSASYGCIPPYVEQNRTMVFLVGRSDLRLISPDRKQVLLYKDFKDVASCAQGHKNAEHFGIICREVNNDGYIGYVFKCQSEHVCDDIVAAISQAFITCAEQSKKKATQIFSCDHCPMLWYHKLCSDVEGLSDKKTQAMIFRRIESLTYDEQDIIWAKFNGSEKMNSPLSEQNQFLMMLLRAHCESRQQRHVHDTAENRSEFLNQYLGGSTIFMKAKRSLTNSFDHLLKRKASKDDIGVVAPPTVREPQIREHSAESRSGNETPPEGFRSRSNTLGGSSPNKATADQLKSPMMDIFIKVGNSPKEAETHQGSWRQAILNSVVTPSKGLENDGQVEFLSPMRFTQPKKGKRSKEELRELWKTAIRQTILLNRMETENAMLQARQNENELKRIKLDYEEIVPCDKQLIERWEQIIERDSMKIGNKKDPKVLAQAIKSGVPRSKRGDVWSFLAEQHSMNTAPVDTKKFPNFNTPYQTLLKNLTEHQHAIFIDLGRTFPNHKFYKDPLGLGQLSLFNLLKAYSILDPELGYCQGLGFICGILLLHCDEADAFQLLKHLMFRRQMRTKYLPDMKKFQLQLYQLSRLVKDHLPELYIWLDQNDVSPTLYAAPWILTVFSSQFPLGFVARVFDLLFLESSEVIFKFAIALLSVHKEALLARDNFEEIMDYLKTVVPKIDAQTMDKIMRMVFTMDISKQLTEYNVEYNVLQEEISTTNHHLEMLKREKAQNQHLEQQLQFAQSSIAQLEKTRTSQQAQITALQTQVQSLELTIQTLGRFVGHLAEHNLDLELPTEVRRVLQQLDDLDRQRKKPIFTERKIGKSLSVNSHLGFPLKVLEELNEREEHGSPQKRKEKTPFFEHTYEQLRQQQQNRGATQRNSSSSNGNANENELSPRSSRKNEEKQRPNRLLDSMEMENKFDDLKLPEHVDKFVSNMKSPLEVDSGVGTPMSPPSTSSNHSHENSTHSSHSSHSGSTTSIALSSLSSNQSLNQGGIFSRMGYKTQPAVLSPLASRQFIPPIPIITTDTINRDENENEHEHALEHEHKMASTNFTRNDLPKTELQPEEMHPLSMAGLDVNVRFNGTTQLKSIKPIHPIRPISLQSLGSSQNTSTESQTGLSHS